MKKKFLVIGASVWQRNGISKLIRSGHKVYVVDSRKNLLDKLINIKKIHIESFNINILLSFVKKYRILKCISFASDFAVPIKNQINKELGKNFYSEKIISIFTKKKILRKFQQKNKFNHPYFIQEYRKISNYKNYKKNFIIKPNISSGSRGVFSTNKFTKKKIFKAKCEFAKKNSLDGQIILEKKIGGYEYGGNCFIKNGKIIDIRITKKILNKSKIIGHIYPSDLNNFTQNNVKNELLKYIKKLNVKNEIINFDIKIYKKKIFIIELAIRNGGNGITDIIKYSSNFDYDKINFDNKLNKLKKKDNFFYCSYLFGSKTTGYVKSLNIDLNNYNFILKKYIFKKKNEEIDKFQNNTQAAGMIIFKIKRITEFYKKKKFFEKKIKLLVKKKI